jgi:hypothetical protein
MKHLTPRAKKILAKISQLRAEGLALYNALPTAERFHECRKKWRIIDGSNRSGKTFTACAECSRAWCGCDPYDKYPRNGGNAIVVGRDGDHLAMLWQKYSEEGAFFIIRDEHTNLWRAVRPHPGDPTRLDDYDQAYSEKWKPAPPLIPRRLIIGGEPAYEDRGKGIPRLLRMKTGWTILWRSSLGKSPQGSHLNLAHFDEHLNDESFYHEAVRGLVAINEPPKWIPRGIWSATPEDLNPQLLDLREAADNGSETVDAFSLFISDNPYIPQEERQIFHDSLPPELRAVKFYGEYATVGRRIYRTYDPAGIHGCEPFEIDPTKFTRFAVLDPGTQHCGTLFYAVDPNEQHTYIYDGFDVRGMDAKAWAQQVKSRENGMKFEAFVIDQRMGRQHSPGSPENVAEQYWRALQDADALPRTAGPMAGFLKGSDDIRGREEALLSMMAIRGAGPFAGSTQLQVMRGVLPELDKQIKRAQMSLKDPNKRIKLDEDLLVCAEYMAASRPYYREPEPAAPQFSRLDAYDSYQRKKSRRGPSQGAKFGSAVEVGSH